MALDPSNSSNLEQLTLKGLIYDVGVSNSAGGQVRDNAVTRFATRISRSDGRAEIKPKPSTV